MRSLEANCPFCRCGLNQATLGGQYAPRRLEVQSGVKRATLFAIGAGFAAACGNPTPIYGSSEAPDFGSSEAATSDVATTGADVTTDGDRSEQAIYGAPVAPSTDTDVSGSSAAVAASSAGTPDGGASDAGVQPTPADASAADASIDPDVSSVASDAALDAASVDAGFDVEPEPTVVAPYGAPPIDN